VRRVVVAVVVVALLAAVFTLGVRLATAPTPIAGYRLIDDYNIAVQITGSKAQWRDVSVAETATTVTITLREIWIHGPGFDDAIAYVALRLREPLGTRTVVDSITGQLVRLLPDPERVSARIANLGAEN
jgi:hypothetical protein